MKVYTWEFGSDSQIYYRVNSILQIFAPLRILVAIKIIVLQLYTGIATVHKEFGESIQPELCFQYSFYSKMYGSRAGSLFTLKCMMKTNPLYFIFMAYLLCIPVFGFMLRICERPLERVGAVEGVTSIYSYWNTMWCVVVTMASSKRYS